MYSKILVPLDGSLLAEHALPVARAIGQRFKSQPEILMVVPNGEKDIKFDENDTPKTYLTAVSEPVEIGAAELKWHVLEGDPSETIVDFAQTQCAGMIVMVTHGRTGLVRTLLGSVTDRVTLTSSVPVIMVNGRIAPTSPISEVKIENVVVPLDGSELAESALEHGKALAEAFAAELLLLRVTEVTERQYDRSVAEVYLSGITLSLKPDTGSTVTRRVISGDPGESIVTTAGTLPNSLIVMSTRGASGLIREIRGSVADHVVRHASVPVMVVPPVEVMTGTPAP